MKKLIPLAVALAVMLAPAAAEAHTLTLRNAKRYATKIAYRVANDGDEYWAGYCDRASSHRVVCTIQLTDRDGITCEADILVKFVSRYSWSMTFRRTTPFNCFESE